MSLRSVAAKFQQNPVLRRNGRWFILLGLIGVLAGSVPGAEKISSVKSKEDKNAPPFVGGLLIDVLGSNYRDPIRLERLVEDIKHCPFSDIYVQVRAYGDAYYDSQLVPRAFGVSKMANDKDPFDPLASLIAGLKTDKVRPRRVFAWIETLRVANVGRGLPQDENHVVKAHPDWLSRNSAFKTEDEEGNQYLDPGVEDVRTHLESVVRELAAKYELAGIAIDGLRYPGLQADWGYSTKALDQWRQKTGSQDAPKPNDPVWGDMRRESLDKALFLMQRAAKQARPGILVAAFGLGEGSVPSTVEDFSSSKVYTGALQNWPKWMKEKTTDLIVLENYRVDEQDNAAFDAWNAFAAALVKQTQVEVLSGIAGSANVSMGVLAQLHRTHELGLMGVVVSNYREPIQDAGSREIFFRALNAGVLSADSRRAPLKEVQLASVKTDDALPIPPPPEPAKMDQERPVEEVIDEIIKQGPKPPEGKYTELIKPSDEAVTYLRRMFSNIFN